MAEATAKQRSDVDSLNQSEKSTARIHPRAVSFSGAPATMETTVKRNLALGATALLALACAPAWSQAPAESRTVAATCANCHGTTGTTVGAMPSLAGQQKSYIVEQMKLFRDGKRPATIMHQIAKGYTDAQIEAVAEYFSKQTRR